MKNKFATIALAMSFAACLGCQSSASKVESARENVQNANEALEKERDDVQRVTNDNEWKIFRLETKAQIEKNDLHIAELRSRKASPGKIFDNLYANRINSLQKKNNDLRKRLNTYDINGGNWEMFKQEFSHDLDDLGKALAGLGKKSD